MKTFILVLAVLMLSGCATTEKCPVVEQAMCPSEDIAIPMVAPNGDIKMLLMRKGHLSDPKNYFNREQMEQMKKTRPKPKGQQVNDDPR